MPEKGAITLFNRSHYEDVLVVRVKNLVPEEKWSKGYHHVGEFERLISDEGTRIIKFFLNISKDEQKARLQSRLDEPAKHWNFEHRRPGRPRSMGRLPGGVPRSP